MKHYLILGLAALSILGACSSDENVDAPTQQKRSIGFNPFLGKLTKAEQTTATFSDFAVWGYMKNATHNVKFMDQIVVTKGADGQWTYSPKQFWENGYSYRFIGVYPAGDGGLVKFGGLPATFEDNNYGTISFDANRAETDLLASIAEVSNVTAETQEEVEMTFHHLLSRVKFAFINAMEDGSSITISDVIMVDAFKNGTATLAQDLHNVTWTINGTDKILDLNFGQAQMGGNGGVITSGKTGYTGQKFLIPWMGENVQGYTVTIKITRRTVPAGIETPYTRTVTLPVPTDGWKPGQSYLFTAEINSTNITDDPMHPIVFSATVDTWPDYPTTEGGIGLPGYDITTTPVTPAEGNE